MWRAGRKMFIVLVVALVLGGCASDNSQGVGPHTEIVFHSFSYALCQGADVLRLSADGISGIATGTIEGLVKGVKAGGRQQERIMLGVVLSAVGAGAGFINSVKGMASQVDSCMRDKGYGHG